MKKYPLHYINEDDFENLVILICRKILGEAVIPFAKGTDGGRDGRFHGKANCFPSESEPWNGKIVIQAKHTNKENASCSDSVFQTILKKDVLPAIKRLRNENKIDYHILFTNRKLTGKQDEKIEDLIDEQTHITNIVLADEKIQQWLQSFTDVVREAKLNDLLRPLQFDEHELKFLIQEFHKTISNRNASANHKTDFKYLEMSKKNELNQLRQDYFDDVIKRSYGYFGQISEFLKNPINNVIKELYQDTIEELNAKISLNRKDYAQFEALLEDLYNYFLTNNPDFNNSGKKRLARVFLNYMYCNCDIGKKTEND